MGATEKFILTRDDVESLINKIISEKIDFERVSLTERLTIAVSTLNHREAQIKSYRKRIRSLVEAKTLLENKLNKVEEDALYTVKKMSFKQKLKLIIKSL